MGRIAISDEEADEAFRQLDEDQVDSVGFETFCSWCARRNSAHAAMVAAEFQQVRTVRRPALSALFRLKLKCTRRAGGSSGRGGGERRAARPERDFSAFRGRRGRHLVGCGLATLGRFARAGGGIGGRGEGSARDTHRRVVGYVRRQW